MIEWISQTTKYDGFASRASTSFIFRLFYDKDKIQIGVVLTTKRRHESITWKTMGISNQNWAGMGLENISNHSLLRYDPILF